MPRTKRTHKAIFQSPGDRRFGKLDRTAKRFFHGDTAGYDRYNLVGTAVVRTGRSRHKRMEKRFFRELKDPQRDFRTLSELKEAGVKVVPDFQLVLSKNEKGELERSLVMADLSERGKKVVIAGNAFANKVEAHKRIAGLKNYGALMRQMERETFVARRIGFDLNFDAWLFVVDPKTNTGKMFVTDADSLWRARRPYHNTGIHGLRRAGIKPTEIRETIKKTDQTIRRAVHPTNIQIQQMAAANPRLRQALSTAIRMAVRRDPRVQEINHLFQFMIGTAIMPQIGGAYTSGRSMGLTKEERRKLDAFISQLSKEERFRRRSTAAEGSHKAVAWTHDQIYGTDWSSRAMFIPTIKKSRSSQWDRNRIGAYVSGEMRAASKRLGSFIFRFDKRKSSEWERVKGLLAAAENEKDIERIVKSDRSVIMNHLIESLYRTFQRDIKFMARLRTLRDLKPYEDPEVIAMIRKHDEDRKEWWKKPLPPKPDYEGWVGR